MITINYTTASGRLEAAHFTTQIGADMFTAWLDGEGLGWSHGGWIPHDGGPCPVEPTVKVYVKFRDGSSDENDGPPWRAGSWGERPEASNWTCTGRSGIIAYRLTQEKPNG